MKTQEQAVIAARQDKELAQQNLIAAQKDKVAAQQRLETFQSNPHYHPTYFQSALEYFHYLDQAHKNAQAEVHSARDVLKSATNRLATLENRGPTLGQKGSMYDILNYFTPRRTSTSQNMVSPSYSPTSGICQLSDIGDLASQLTSEEKDEIFNHKNSLWIDYSGGLDFVAAVEHGSVEGCVDQYVRLVIKSVATALKLPLRLENLPSIGGKRADHWVLALSHPNRTSRLVGCIGKKLPNYNYGQPYVLEDDSFYIQIYDQMTEIANYYGTNPALGIGSTGREWKFFSLYEISNLDQVEQRTSTRDERYSPVTTNMGPVDNENRDDSNMEASLGNEESRINETPSRSMFASVVYKWDDPNMLYALGALLKQMYYSVRTQTSTIDQDSIRSKVMWNLLRMDEQHPWGWSTLSVSRLQWNTMMDDKSDNVVVLSMLGMGADGNVLLVADKLGRVAAMKLVASDQEAVEEANNWNDIYSDFMQEFKWNVRKEKWMGLPAVILPRLNQFITKEERLDNLENVRACLVNRFHNKRWIHEDVYWRNIAYLKSNGSIIVIMLDLHPERVRRYASDSEDGSWVDRAIEALRNAASLNLPTNLQ